MNTFTPTKRSEVDIRVAQELKNNQDFVYQTNQRLQSLEQTIVSLRKENEFYKNKFESSSKAFEILVENLRAIVNKQAEICKDKLYEFEFMIDVHYANMKAHIENCEKKFCTKEELLHETKTRSVTDIVNHQDLMKLDQFVKEAINIIQRSAQAGLDGLRRELTPILPEIDPLEQKVNEKLTAWKVDKDGLVKEIALLKKSSAYAEKKFENIYTLLERQKEELCLKKAQ